MENDVINLKSLSSDAPFVQYNDWTNLSIKQQVRTVGRTTGVNVKTVPRQHKKQLAFHQSLAKCRFVFGGLL